MKNNKIVFKGYLDKESGWEFDAPLVMVEPYVDEHPVGNIGELENIVEDYMIDLSIGEGPKKDNEMIPAKEAKKEYKKALNGSKRFQPFECVVHYNEETLTSNNPEWDIKIKENRYDHND